MPKSYRVYGREYHLEIDARLNDLIQSGNSLYYKDLRNELEKALQQPQNFQPLNLPKPDLNRYCEKYCGVGILDPLEQLDHSIQIEQGLHPRQTASPLPNLRGQQRSHEHYQAVTGVTGEGAAGAYLELRYPSQYLLRLIGTSPDCVNYYKKNEETVLVLAETKATMKQQGKKGKRLQPEDLIRSWHRDFFTHIKSAATGSRIEYDACLIGVVIRAHASLIEIELASLRVSLDFYRDKVHPLILTDPPAAFTPHTDPGEGLRDTLRQQEINARNGYEGGLTKITNQVILFYAKESLAKKDQPHPSASDILSEIETQAVGLGENVVKAWENAPGGRAFHQAVIAELY
jgi:hypothetical protein